MCSRSPCCIVTRGCSRCRFPDSIGEDGIRSLGAESEPPKKKDFLLSWQGLSQLKPWTLFTIVLSTSFFPLQKYSSPLALKGLSCGLTWIAILWWSQINSSLLEKYLQVLFFFFFLDQDFSAGKEKARFTNDLILASITTKASHGYSLE